MAADAARGHQLIQDMRTFAEADVNPPDLKFVVMKLSQPTMALRQQDLQDILAAIADIAFK